MPVTPTYPGVYILEAPSGVHTITGVATSIAAFAGYASMGPTKTAKRINSFADFERYCGGIRPNSYLGYSVKQFFENGGTDAYIVRLAGDGTTGAADAGLKFQANSPGNWSNFFGVTIRVRAGSNPPRFRVAIVKFAADDSGKAITNPPNPPPEVEAFENLSTDVNDARYVLEVINDDKRGSQYIAMDPNDLGGNPATTEQPVPFQGGTDGNIPDDPDVTVTNEVILGQLDTAQAEGGALDQIDLFNQLCVPGMTDGTRLGGLLAYCKSRRAFLIADCGRNATLDQMRQGPGISGGLDVVNYGAMYFPWIKAQDPLSQNRVSDFPPCGFVAGIYARTDGSRGVWKAPAGLTDGGVVGAVGPKLPMNDLQNGSVNIKGINCFRNFPVYNTVTWGARTLAGDDEAGSEWKYIPVRRMALFIEESLYRGLKWVVFEPNDEPLWSQIRLNVGAFMQDLFRKGAFQGRAPREAYFVRCDKTTTTQNDINRGIVNIIVGFAPLKPAEFVILTIQQIAGDILT